MVCNEANRDKLPRTLLSTPPTEMLPASRSLEAAFPLPFLSPGGAVGEEMVFYIPKPFPGQKGSALGEPLHISDCSLSLSAPALTPCGAKPGARTSMLGHSLWLLYKEGVGAAVRGAPGKRIPDSIQGTGTESPPPVSLQDIAEPLKVHE